MKFIKPEPFNGANFVTELAQSNIVIEDFYQVNENELVVEGNVKDQAAITNLLKNHNGSESPDLRKSALAKLAALGLTEDEIAAL